MLRQLVPDQLRFLELSSQTHRRTDALKAFIGAMTSASEGSVLSSRNLDW
jgi:hypothetical protein